MLKLLAQNWFLTEPALFALYCKQQLQENAAMECAVRCGEGRLEYNPLLLKHKNYAEVEALMRIEMIRLYLKHPYERKPTGCCNEAASVGSDITIADGYCLLKKDKLPLRTPEFYHLPLGQYYEWYAKQIQQQSDRNHDRNNNTNNPQEAPHNSESASDNPSTQQQREDTDKSALWKDDSLQRQLINELIERTTDWGTLPANVVERIQASTNAHVQNNLIWQGFHSAMLNSQRKLTRMRPNRRTGFLQMGSTRQFDTHLLVGIDVSGSIDKTTLQEFYGTVNRIFSYGHVQIDVCQFDVALGPIAPMLKTNKLNEIQGRGGTSFQPIIDYTQSHAHHYDGLLILTDGQAPAPLLPPHWHTPLLWVCHNRTSYQQNHEWMQELGRCCHLTNANC